MNMRLMPVMLMALCTPSCGLLPGCSSQANQVSQEKQQSSPALYKATGMWMEEIVRTGPCGTPLLTNLAGLIGTPIAFAVETVMLPFQLLAPDDSKKSDHPQIGDANQRDQR